MPEGSYIGSQKDVTPVPHGMLIFKEHEPFIFFVSVLQSQGRSGAEISVLQREQLEWSWNFFCLRRQKETEIGFRSEINAVLPPLLQH